MRAALIRQCPPLSEKAVRRLMKQEGQSGVSELKCSEFGQAIVKHM